MIRTTAATVIMVGTLAATGALAQTQAAEGPPTGIHPHVGVFAYAPALRPGGTSLTNREEPGLLRRAMPDGDILDWIAETDPVVERLRTPGAPSARAGLLFEIGPDGRAADCRIEDGGDNPYAPGLCERMSERMRLRPALNLAGERVADQYFVYVWFAQNGQESARVVNHQSLPPSPAPPLPGGGWPLYWASTVVTVAGLDLLARRRIRAGGGERAMGGGHGEAGRRRRSDLPHRRLVRRRASERRRLPGRPAGALHLSGRPQGPGVAAFRKVGPAGPGDPSEA